MLVYVCVRLISKRILFVRLLTASYERWYLLAFLFARRLFSPPPLVPSYLTIAPCNCVSIFASSFFIFAGVRRLPVRLK